MMLDTVNSQMIIENLDTISNVFLAVSAFIALCIAFRQNMLHKRSHRPYCDIYCIDFPRNIGIKLKNNGTGAMTITSFGIYDNDPSESHNNFRACIDPKVSLTYYGVDIKDRSIAPGASLTLLEKKDIDTEPSDKYKRLREELKKYTIRLTYKDMYGKKYSRDKDLSKIYG